MGRSVFALGRGLFAVTQDKGLANGVARDNQPGSDRQQQAETPGTETVNGAAVNGEPGRRPFWSHEERISAWTNARVTRTLDRANWRYDDAGNLIFWGAYCNPHSPYGWEIVALGGGDGSLELRPVHLILERHAGGRSHG